MGTWTWYPSQTQWWTVSAECEKFDSRCVETTLCGKGAVRSGSVENCNGWYEMEKNGGKKINKRDLDLDSMRQNETRGASKSPRLAMQTSSVYAVVCCHNYTAGVLGFGGHYSAICHPLLRITAIHIGHFQVFKTRDWALRGVDDLCQGCRVGNVGLPSQRVNMIVLGLELSNTSQHLWPSVKGRLLCKCNWLQIEVTLLTMYY